MTRHTHATDRTTADRGQPAVPAVPARARAELVAAGGPVTDADLHRLLRRRLLVFACLIIGAAVVSIVAGLAMWLNGFMVFTRDASGFRDWFLVGWRTHLMLAIALASAFVLLRLPPPSVRGLRWIELVLFGVVAVVILENGVEPSVYGTLELAPGESADFRRLAIYAYSSTMGVNWFIVLTSYGVLIPNTWRRSAAVCGLLGLSPVVLFVVYGSWVRPLAPVVFVHVLINVGFFNAMAVAIVVFASARIEHYRRQATVARTFGQYVLGERLGAGGMGEVYRAEHVLLLRPCAVKVIRPDRAGDPNVFRRFEREVRITATLTHPNTIQVYDYGHAEDGTFYFVMEYLPGMTLEALVRRHGPLPPARAVHFLRQVCAALGEAHGLGLIHRDVKPGNVMVCERGGVRDVVKLLDFGLVLPPTDHGSLTRDGAVTGTPTYMSPEQAGGRDGLDARSDIYSVGALAYFLLTGRPPFADRSVVKVLAAHLYETPPPLTRLRADVPVDLEAVVLRCLAKEPSERYSDVGQLEQALADCRLGPAWTVRDAAAWWARESKSKGQGGAEVMTGHWSDPEAAADR